MLLGNGDGTFQPQVTYAVGSEPDALVAGDFNGDGRTDLAVANDGSNDVSVLLGNGDGTFQAQVTYAVGSGPVALVAGDFNGDGRTDLAVANYGSNDVSVLLGNGDGTFQTQVTYAVGSVPDRASWRATSTATAGPTWPSPTTAPTTCRCLLGNGDGTFQSQVTYARGVRADALVAGDFNGDGRTDLAVANSGSNDVSVLAGQRRRHLPAPGDVTRWGPVPTPSWRATSTATAGPTWPSPTHGSNDVSVLLGNGDGTFQTQVTYAVGSEPAALVAGDFNGDGRTDLAVANFGANDVSVLLGNGDGTFQTQVTYAVGSGPDALVAGDFNGDGRTDLAVANLGDDDVSVLLGNGDGTFQTQVTYAVGTDADRLVAGDFNGDGRTDLAVANAGSDDVSVLLGNGDGTFQPQVTYAVGFAPVALVAGDFNGDGRTDLAIANARRQRRVGVAGQRRRHLPDPGDATRVGSTPAGLVTGDFNGDGRTDLATANADSNDVSVLLNLNGTFAAPGPFVTTPQATPLVADLTGDGVDDVLVVNGAGDILWRRGQPARAGHVRSAHHDQSRPSLAGHRRRGHEPGPGARQRRRHRRCGLVVRLARRQLRPDRLAPHRFAPRADRHGRPERRRHERPGGAERGRRHPLGLFQHRQRERPVHHPATPVPPPGDSDRRPRRLGRDPGGCLG